VTDPPNPELLTMLEAFADEGRWDRDEIVLEMSSVLPQRYPNDPEVLTWCTYCYWIFNENTEEAKDIMLRVARDPKAPPYAWIVLAGWKGPQREAIAALRQADRIQPGNVRTLGELLDLYTSLGMTDEAFELARAILVQETMPLEDRYGDEFNDYVNDVFIGRFERDRLRERANAIIEARGRA